RDVLERAVELDPNLAWAHHQLAFVYGDLGETERAAEAAARAAELNPSYTKAETNLSLDRYSAARYDELLGEHGARPEVTEGTLAHYSLGLAFRQRGLYDEALREFRLALERGEDAYLVQQAEAELFLLRGEGAEAAERYARLLEQEPASPKLWNEQGVAAHQQGDPAEAERCYRRALELDPTYALAWNNLGVIQHHRGDAAAERSFREALDRGRAPGDVWRNLGLMLARDGKPRQAAEAYRQALELEPDSASAWTGLGAVLVEAGHPEEARSALVRAVDL